MKIDDIIGIVVIKCDCGEKFIYDTERSRSGVLIYCNCGRHMTIDGPIQHTYYHYEDVYGDPKEVAKRRKGIVNYANAVPLAEYKGMYATFVIDGRKPKVPAKHKNAVSFNENDEYIQNAVIALTNLGMKRPEIMNKINIVLDNGCTRMTDEIVLAILSL